MLKVYLRGYDRPYAVFGDLIFEDERFFVISAGGIVSKIPWSNISWIESNDMPQNIEPIYKNEESPAPAPKPISRNINVNFTGHKSQSFVINIPDNLLTGKYTPELARVIFSDKKVQAFSGDFIITGLPEINADNITFTTLPLDNGKTAAVAAVKDKLDVATKAMAGLTVAGSAPKLSSPLDIDLAIYDPFETPISFKE